MAVLVYLLMGILYMFFTHFVMPMISEEIRRDLERTNANYPPYIYVLAMPFMVALWPLGLWYKIFGKK